MTIEERLRAFFNVGYRPSLKSHLVVGERENWATLYWREWMRNADGEIVFLSEPRADSIGWAVDATSVLPDRPRVIGGVFATVDEALTYAEEQLAEIVGQ